MPRLRFQSIRFILILAFSLSLLIPVLAMTLYGHIFTSRALSQQASERSLYEVHLQAQHIVHALERANSDVLYLASMRSFQQLRRSLNDSTAADTVNLWRQEAIQDFLVFAAVNPMYYRLRYINGQGDEVITIDSDSQYVRSVPIENLRNHSEQIYFRQTMALEANEVYVSSFDLDSDANRTPIIRYAIKLPDEDGIVMLDIYASWIVRNIPTVRGTDFWALINQEGQYLLYPVLTNSALSFSADPVFNTTHPYINRFNRNNIGTFETDSSVFVFSRIYPSASKPDTYWILYREVAKNMLYVGVNDFYRKSLFIVVVAVLTANALGPFISGNIIRPLLDLQRKAFDFARGLPVVAPTKPTRIYEVDTLNYTFYDMAQELEKQRAEKRALIKKLIDTQEEERKLIAYDLHDGLIQQMVGARLYISTVRSTYDEVQPQVSQQIELGCAALTEAIVEGRRIIQGLHPTILDDLGLVEAITELAYQMAQVGGWQLQLEMEALPTQPEKIVSVTAFRIVQEALNNIRKHAHAEHVTIRLVKGNGLALLVEDDGSGFDITALNGRGGLGVHTMRERATLIGGHCTIDTAPGHGTRIHVWIPTEHVETEHES